jgi:hypothetical protein
MFLIRSDNLLDIRLDDDQQVEIWFWSGVGRSTETEDCPWRARRLVI